MSLKKGADVDGRLLLWRSPTVVSPKRKVLRRVRELPNDDVNSEYRHPAQLFLYGGGIRRRNRYLVLPNERVVHYDVLAPI